MDIDLGILKNIFTKKEDIKNNLTSTDTDKPLSAAQGKELQRQINNITSGETPTDHNHDDRYYTESEINTQLSNKADKINGASQITDENRRYYTKISSNDDTQQSINTGINGALMKLFSNVNSLENITGNLTSANINDIDSVSATITYDDDTTDTINLVILIM